ncbi:biotin carboxylase N-terminal domain-containing protein [Streptomyces sp. BI20]|uniref:ATP-binding protein n=1 Tax=Streptomyces sp. BI20 TaxID=3403460 RepID=UPI003C7174C7
MTTETPAGPIRRLLIANRGEIAVRIQRTCRALGIETVAVFSDPDADAPHVRAADAAVRLPGAAPADTYLRADLVLAAARASGADAVHPGYGFLSENHAFARLVQDAGLRWIGPPPAAIEAMASKTRAKKLMGLPTLTEAADITDADLPVLVKAASGGGGRGMRVVRERAELPAALTAARAEALAAFGDGEVFIEPYLEDGRHVEVQILADAHGTVWTLGTRDCSLQRRHQKVIEEAPAPALPPALAEELRTQALRAARATDYRGAGTVEFLVRAGRAHFLEMNTRLQVEHPVTEAVFGLDLVAWQLRIAEGAALPPEPPAPTGHAVEARLYAEDPAHDWRPHTGTLHTLDLPEHRGPDHLLRVDSGVGPGDTVTPHYDPMLAKVIAHAPTRAEALRALAGALSRARIHGVTTNRDLLVATLVHPEVTDPDATRLDTGFYARRLPELTAPERAPDPRPAVLAAALAATVPPPGAGLARRLGALRTLPSAPQTRRYADAAGPDPDTVHEARWHQGRGGPVPDPGHHPDTRVVDLAADRVVLELGGIRRVFHVKQRTDPADPHHDPLAADTVWVDSALGSHTLTRLPRFTEPEERTEPGSLLAPMPGTVVRVAEGLAPGSPVTAGQPLLWLEAMKMEHRVLAPASGTLTALHVAPGRQVEAGALLAVVQEETQP